MVSHQNASLVDIKEIPLRARVRFKQFGTTLAGRVVGISHGAPMRYDLRLDDGAFVANVPEPEIDAVIDEPTSRPSVASPRRDLPPYLALLHT
jgi:hypothetical protein